mgnify:CR=1 FL=1
MFHDDDDSNEMVTDCGNDIQQPPESRATTQAVAETILEYFDNPKGMLPHPDFVKDNFFVEVHTFLSSDTDINIVYCHAFLSYASFSVVLTITVCVGGYHPYSRYSQFECACCEWPAVCRHQPQRTESKRYHSYFRGIPQGRYGHYSTLG